MATPKPCKDCGAWGTEKRPLAAPGPRCFDCRRRKKIADSARSHAAAILKKYGLSDEDYARIYEFQNGKCWTCQIATGATKRLAVHHDHDTGLALALLCGPCNHIVLGKLARDRRDYFDRALLLFTNPPALQLGIVARAPR